MPRSVGSPSAHSVGSLEEIGLPTNSFLEVLLSDDQVLNSAQDFFPSFNQQTSRETQNLEHRIQVLTSELESEKKNNETLTSEVHQLKIKLKESADKIDSLANQNNILRTMLPPTFLNQSLLSTGNHPYPIQPSLPSPDLQSEDLTSGYKDTLKEKKRTLDHLISLNHSLRLRGSPESNALLNIEDLLKEPVISKRRYDSVIKYINSSIEEMKNRMNQTTPSPTPFRATIAPPFEVVYPIAQGPSNNSNKRPPSHKPSPIGSKRSKPNSSSNRL